jgi:hypothetical protein
MQIANAGKQLNAPRAGVQKVFNADGTVTEIPYMEDRFGRRTVMTREGPRVIPGHEGKDVYGDLGGKIGNVLGGLINKGRLGRQERIAEKSVAQQELDDPTFVGPRAPENLAEVNRARERLNYKPPQEKINYFDMSGVGTKQQAVDKLVEIGGEQYVQRTITTPSGSHFEIRDPNTGQLIRSSKVSASGSPAGQTDIFASQPKVLTQEEQKIQDFLPDGVSVDGRAGTIQATSEQRRQARERADRPARQLDLELLEYLTPDERDEYRNRDTTNARFKSLDTKARVNKTKGKVVDPTFTEKEKIKKDAKRRFDLQEGSASRKSSLEQAERFLGAFEGNEEDLEYFNLDEVDSGAGRAAASYIPGAYSSQGQFDEELDAFAETAARQMLKAMGEVRPTDNDVIGAKKAVFGIGKDERTNIRLLKKYIAEQRALEIEATEFDLSFLPVGEREEAAQAIKDGKVTIEQLRASE